MAGRGRLEPAARWKPPPHRAMWRSLSPPTGSPNGGPNALKPSSAKPITPSSTWPNSLVVRRPPPPLPRFQEAQPPPPQGNSGEEVRFAAAYGFQQNRVRFRKTSFAAKAVCRVITVHEILESSHEKRGGTLEPRRQMIEQSHRRTLVFFAQMAQKPNHAPPPPPRAGKGFPYSDGPYQRHRPAHDGGGLSVARRKSGVRTWSKPWGGSQSRAFFWKAVPRPLRPLPKACGGVEDFAGGAVPGDHLSNRWGTASSRLGNFLSDDVAIGREAAAQP